MGNNIQTVLGKTLKIAGVTCLALSGAAIVATGAAVLATVEGGKYVKDAVLKILKEPSAGEVTGEAVSEEAATEEAAPVETATGEAAVEDAPLPATLAPEEAE